MLRTGTITRDFTVRLLCATELFADTGNQQEEIIMRAIKDQTKVLMCFGTSADRQKDRQRSSCSTQPSKNSGWDISTVGVGANSQKSLCSSEGGDESFLLRFCKGLLKMQPGDVQSLSPKHPGEMGMVAVLKVNKMYTQISGKGTE